MELPKNVTQIGESDRFCKIYVEDYVVSYLKQLNQTAGSKDIAVALYGVRKTEGDVAYLFLYGACKLDFLQRETKHLSQAQQQEIEKCRQRYFSEHEFLGYRVLNGDMIEGFHICDRGICRYITGYAQFYEKNDSMLNFMLETRSDEAQPEVVDQEKYETVKRRQEERKSQGEESKAATRRVIAPRTAETGMSNEERRDLTQVWKSQKSGRTSLRGMKAAAVAVFALLCVVGVNSLNGGQGIEDIQVWARQTLAGVTEQKLPDEDAQGAVEAMSPNDTLVAEDRLTDAILQENQQSMQESAAQESNAAEGNNTPQEGQEAEATGDPAETSSGTGQEEKNDGTESTAPAEGPAMTAYEIRQGDTLTSICIRNYGSDARLSEICHINEIADPDDIKVGQKILLPQ
ncbi:MAG: LysM peptidoglycan-binding domain-containing protein [Candidatus Gastranaerophilales bacterium]|nr:LysM peptidoglycan-binding domain-containing protein [Candidatus Gastranaerophilales bacterium]